LERSHCSAQEVLRTPKFQQLRSQRARLRWVLSGATLIMFFGLIVLVMTARNALGVNIPGSSTPLWFGLIFAMTVLVVVFTGLYVHQSNSRFDRLTDDLIRELGQ
jgi:uncharacterized membrane protein (DUF485 family)